MLNHEGYHSLSRHVSMPLLGSNVFHVTVALGTNSSHSHGAIGAIRNGFAFRAVSIIDSTMLNTFSEGVGENSLVEVVNLVAISSHVTSIHFSIAYYKIGCRRQRSCAIPCAIILWAFEHPPRSRWLAMR